MPIYCFECPQCGQKAEVLRAMKDSHLTQACQCESPMRRDLQSERLGSTDLPYATPVLSDAMGVAPSQVAEHRRLYPDIPLTNDGRVICTSHRERKRIMRTLGFHDKDGY